MHSFRESGVYFIFLAIFLPCRALAVVDCNNLWDWGFGTACYNAFKEFQTCLRSNVTASYNFRFSNETANELLKYGIECSCGPMNSRFEDCQHLIPDEQKIYYLQQHGCEKGSNASSVCDQIFCEKDADLIHAFNRNNDSSVAEAGSSCSDFGYREIAGVAIGAVFCGVVFGAVLHKPIIRLADFVFVNPARKVISRVWNKRHQHVFINQMAERISEEGEREADGQESSELVEDSRLQESLEPSSLVTIGRLQGGRGAAEYRVLKGDPE